MKSVILSLAVGLALLASPALAQDRPVPGYGTFHALPDAGEQPDPQRVYEVVFDLSIGGDAEAVSRSMGRVALFVNLLAAGGVDADHRHIVAVVHGGASPAVMSNEAWAERHDGKPNPSAELIEQLIAAGVDVRICGQSMMGQNLTPSDLIPGVKADLSALMTVIHFQQRGYVVVVN